MADDTVHRLLNNGGPFDDGGNPRGGTGVSALTGPGRAKCQCGELSEVLPSLTARRRWLTRHKG